MSRTVSAWFAELSDNKMCTDIGPGCPQCKVPDGQGLWLYLIPSEDDCEAFLGHGAVIAQCVGCHRIEHFDVSYAQCETVQRVRGAHEAARAKPHDTMDTSPRERGAVYNIILGMLLMLFCVLGGCGVDTSAGAPNCSGSDTYCPTCEEIGCGSDVGLCHRDGVCECTLPDGDKLSCMRSLGSGGSP